MRALECEGRTLIAEDYGAARARGCICIAKQIARRTRLKRDRETLLNNSNWELLTQDYLFGKLLWWPRCVRNNL